ncbi:MAG: hypothetical protein EGR16_08925 [Clostridiales bacterium]|nr:hypothetical protein [Clostridiales bacterium]
MKFTRLTSVFLFCALLSSILVVPASAADDVNYYSLAPVSSSEPSLAVDYPVNPAEFSDSDSTVLSSILHFVQFITTSPSSFQSRSIIGMLDRIGELVYQISQNSGGADGVAQETTLSAFKDLFTSFHSLDSQFPGDTVSFSDYLSSLFSLTTSPALTSSTNDEFHANQEKGFVYNSYAYGADGSLTPHLDSQYSFSGLMSTLLSTLIYDGNLSSLTSGGPTLYRLVALLQQTLASEDDRQLAQNYKENREQAETDFLSGKSGKTSLGKDDFGSLSSVGGTFKDTISLNGQSSLSDLTSGLSDADTAGQGWFSQATKDSLDAVSGSGSSESTVSTFSDDGLSSVDVDPDPYHMQGFENNYAWLWGDD